MKLLSKPEWLTKPIDVIVLQSAPGKSGGFCKITANDFYEDINDYDNEELASFCDLYEALFWLSNNGYAPTEAGREDGNYRNVKAAEWFYDKLVRKPVPVPVKRMEEPVRLSPVREKIMFFLAA